MVGKCNRRWIFDFHFPHFVFSPVEDESLMLYGSEAEIYLYGGCLTSWKVSGGKDLLFVRPDAVFNKKKPIRFVGES